MHFRPEIPFNRLPPLPPKVDVETKGVLKKAIEAGRALAELKGLGPTIPNQALLIDSLVLQEARASSEIENILTTNDALYRAFSASSDADPQTKEVLRYREAVWLAYNRLRKRPLLTTNLFVDTMRTIKGHEGGIRNTPGTRILNASTGTTVYTPPEGEDLIRQKLRSLEEYIHQPSSIDPLIRMAMVHYQFEAIHPFADGNGRTGRIINILFLIQQGLLDLPVLYLSRYLIRTKADYYRLLREVTEKENWSEWIEYILEGVDQTAITTRKKIVAVRDLMDKTLHEAKEKLPERLVSKELVELLFRQPYTKVQILVSAGIARRQTAAEYLKAYEEAGILTSTKLGRENLFLNVELFRLLNARDD